MLGTVEDNFAETLSPGDTFFFSGLVLEVERIDGIDLIVHATSKSARIPTYMGARMAISTNLADRVRAFLHDRSQWQRFPDPVRDWLRVQEYRSAIPRAGPASRRDLPARASSTTWPPTASRAGTRTSRSGMLITRRMESAGLKPLGFVANDYALACYGLEPIADPAALFSADILEKEFVDWVEGSHLLKRAFREVAVIGGLVERAHPGKRKTGKQVTFSTDLIYDVLRRYEPDHLLLKAAWADAREKMTDVGRLARLLDRAQRTMLHVELDRVSPMAVPVLTIIGRERMPQGSGRRPIADRGGEPGGDRDADRLSPSASRSEDRRGGQGRSARARRRTGSSRGRTAPPGSPTAARMRSSATIRRREKIDVWKLPERTGYTNLNTGAFDGDGIHWFTGQNGIYGRLDPKTGKIEIFKDVDGRGPYGIASTPAGDVYYVSLAGSHLARIDRASGAATVIEPPTPGRAPAESGPTAKAICGSRNGIAAN